MPRLLKGGFATKDNAKGKRPQGRWLLAAAVAAGVAAAVFLAITGIGIQMVHQPLHLRPCTVNSSCPSDGVTPLDAISYICTGSGCNIELLCTSAMALRVAAGWRGPTYVITDRPNDVREGCTEDLQTVPVPEIKHQMHMKNMKRNLLTILPGNPTSALYIDGDVVPVGCLHRFLAEVAAGPGGSPDLAFFHDNVCLGCNTFNGGFVYQRDTPATRQCLADWNVESSADNFTRYVKDQDALDNVLKAKQCQSIRTLPSSAVAFVDSALWPAWVRMQFSRLYFLHFTTGVRLGRSWAPMQAAMLSQLRALERTGAAFAHC